VAQLSHPALAYERPFRAVDAPAGTAVAGWLNDALVALPRAVRRERLAALRAQLISLFALRAQLIDERPGTDLDRSRRGVFYRNLLDMLVAGLAVAPTPATRRPVTALDRAGDPRA
jgi:hypothetical protein